MSLNNRKIYLFTQEIGSFLNFLIDPKNRIFSLDQHYAVDIKLVENKRTNNQ